MGDRYLIIILLVYAAAAWFLSCSPENVRYSPCQERCRYMELDCRSLCGPEGISLTFVYSKDRGHGITSCQERCSDLYSNCMVRCDLEKGDGE